MRKIINNYLQFLHFAERLKCELRHSWLSDGRQESVAEHSWRIALMTVMLAEQLDQPVDLLKSLKMALIHDLVEAEVGDIPIFENSERKANKQQAEARAMDNIRAQLGGAIGDEFYHLWHELEARQTYEAKFVNALDKIEVIIQHTEADIATWNDWEKNYNADGAYDHCKFDRALATLSELVQEEVADKLAEVEV